VNSVSVRRVSLVVSVKTYTGVGEQTKRPLIRYFFSRLWLNVPKDPELDRWMDR
jgi:hypothetical protein